MNKKIFSVLLIAFLSAGCAAKRGHQFLAKMSNEEIAHKLVKNKTSQEEVKVMFGDPEDVDIDSDGGETWLYKYIRSESKGINFVPIVSSFYQGTNDSIKKLKIKFNSNGVLEKFAFSNAKGETKAGLFQ
jgi:outer membrane protein assembly factor BamE (lipoprotein component of BamABCDE complex)